MWGIIDILIRVHFKSQETLDNARTIDYFAMWGNTVKVQKTLFRAVSFTIDVK